MQYVVQHTMSWPKGLSAQCTSRFSFMCLIQTHVNVRTYRCRVTGVVSVVSSVGDTRLTGVSGVLYRRYPLHWCRVRVVFSTGDSTRSSWNIGHANLLWTIFSSCMPPRPVCVMFSSPGFLRSPGVSPA